MLKYLYLSAKRDATPLNRALDRFLGEIPFWPTHLTIRRTGRSLLIAAEVTGAAAPGQRNLAIDLTHRFSAFEGLPIGQHLQRPPEQWAEAIGASVNADRERFFTQTAGAFGVLYGRVGRDVTAFADFTGGAPIYYADHADFVAISNRAGLIGRAVMDGTPDILGLSFLSGQANMFVPFSSYVGVRSLRPGWGVTINARGRLKLFRLPQFWSPESERRQLVDSDFDLLTEHLGAPLSHLKGVPFHELTLSLTGGRDSRLCLALAQSAGLEPMCWTGGVTNSPEIECARSVADLVGAAYRAETFEPKAFDFSSYWERLKFNTHRYDGMLCLFDGNLGAASQPRSRTEIKGLGGEIFSIHIKAHQNFAPSSLKDAIRTLRDYQQPTDPLGVQQRAVTREQREFLTETITEKAGEGVPLEDIRDLLYIENRMPLWSAILALRMGNLALQPFCNFRAATIAYAAAARHRRTWRYHYEALSRLSPRLAGHPFLGPSWDSALAPFMKGPIPPPFTSTTQASLTSLAASQVLALNAGWRTITELLLDHPSSGLFDVVDRRSLIDVLRAGPEQLNGYGVKQIHALIGMQMFLSGMGQRQFEGYTGVAPAIDSNVAGWRLRHEGDDWQPQRKRHPGSTVSPATGVPRDIVERTPIASRNLTFSAAKACRLRIDPQDRAGLALIGRIVISKGRKKLVISPEDMRFSGTRIVGRKDALTLIQSDGDDPQIHIDLAPLKRGKRPIRVEAELCVPHAHFVIEAFLDHGSGYTRDGMRRLVVDGGADEQARAARLIAETFPDIVSEPQDVGERRQPHAPITVR